VNLLFVLAIPVTYLTAVKYVTGILYISGYHHLILYGDGLGGDELCRTSKNESCSVLQSDLPVKENGFYD